jgi:hypothetical protein
MRDGMIVPEKLNDQLIFTTVQIRTNRGSGTGFFFRHKSADGITEYIITNRHVIEGASEASIRVHTKIKKDDSSFESKPSYSFFDLNIKNFNQLTYSHPDPHIDLALIPASPITMVASGKGVSPYFIGYDESFVQIR